MLEAPHDIDALLRVSRNRPTLIGDMHWHRHIEIILGAKASTTFSVAGNPIDLGCGEIMIFSAMLPHTVTRIDAGSEVFVINLPMEQFFAWSLPQAFRSAVFRGDVLRYPAENLINNTRFGMWCADTGSGDTERIIAATLEIEAMVRRMAAQPLPLPTQADVTPSQVRRIRSDRLAQVIDHISFNLRNPALDVKSIAAAVDLNPRYLSTLFRKLTGITPTAYIRRARISVAYALLTETDKSISEVVHLSGFGSVSQFYEVMKRETGLTPGDLRKEELPAFVARDRHHRQLPRMEAPCVSIPSIDNRWLSHF